MDIVTMATAKPKVIDLNKFACELEEGVPATVDTALWGVAYQSMSNGAKVMLEFEDIDGELKKACSGNRNLVVRSTLQGGTMDFPAFISRNGNGVAGQFAFGFTVIDGETVVETNIAVQFNYTSNVVKLMATCKVL